MDQNLIIEMFEKYKTREEISYRLPLSVSMKDFWVEELEYRKSLGRELPLLSHNGNAYWFVPTEAYLKSGDNIAALARSESSGSVEPGVQERNLIDEAYFSSAIEGAYTTRQKARELIQSGKAAADKSERMILNNYKALTFIQDHLEAPITEALILEVGRILTEGTLEEDTAPGYRNDAVFVRSGHGDIVYTAPGAEHVKPMMEQLIAYVGDPDVHPLEKAAVAHIYFVTIHPFFDGNGRTARALSYMILLKAGYDFYKQVPISSILAEERSSYYKAIKACQNPENGYDITYFVQYYVGMLERSANCVKDELLRMERYERLKKSHMEQLNDRILAGAGWVIQEPDLLLTTEKWQKKYAVSFETARQDLNALVSADFLIKITKGHKHYYKCIEDISEKPY